MDRMKKFNVSTRRAVCDDDDEHLKRLVPWRLERLSSNATAKPLAAMLRCVKVGENSKKFPD